jgi:hypothetical protein
MSLGAPHRDHQVTANGAYLDVKPASAGETWRVKGAYFGRVGGATTVAGDLRVVRTDGTNEIEVESSEAAKNGYHNMPWLVDSTSWIRLKNSSGVSMVIGYDAVEVQAAS